MRCLPTVSRDDLTRKHPTIPCWHVSDTSTEKLEGDIRPDPHSSTIRQRRRRPQYWYPCSRIPVNRDRTRWNTAYILEFSVLAGCRPMACSEVRSNRAARGWAARKRFLHVSGASNFARRVLRYRSESSYPPAIGNHLSVVRLRDDVPTVITASGPEANSINRLPVLATRDVSAVRMFTVKVPDASADASSV